MRAYVIRRLLLVIPTLLILTVLVFLTTRFIPGDVVDAMVSRNDYLALEVDADALRRELGLDRPLPLQYARWMGGLVRGSLGQSLLGNWTVEEKLLERLPITLELGLLAIVVGLLIAVPVGVFSALRQDTIADYAGRTLAILGLATPNFWLALMVIIYPAIWWGWTPPLELVRFSQDPLRNLLQFIIPAAILGTALAAGTMRLTRTMMLEVLRQDYIRTAWSKGLRERLVVVRHGLKNAMIPVITGIGLSLPLLIGGSVIIENIFNIPGLGRLTLSALQDRDYPVISGVNLFFASSVLIINLLIDLIYPYLDPRVRYR